MGRIVITEYISLDGVVEAPKRDRELRRVRAGPTCCPRAGPRATSSSWTKPWPPTPLLLGRVTYEGFAPVWPHFEGGLRGQVQHDAEVRRSPPPSNPRVEQHHPCSARGDIVEEATQGSKQRYARDIVVHGSPQLAQTSIQHDLVDALHLQVYPVNRRRRQAPLQPKRARRSGCGLRRRGPSATASTSSSTGRHRGRSPSAVRGVKRTARIRLRISPAPRQSSGR